MAEDSGSDHLAQLLVPYCRREREDADGPDHKTGWWFAGAPPDVVREALAVIHSVPGLRVNDQPPEEWLVEQAAIRNGVLAGFAAPARNVSPRVCVDAIIVPSSEAMGLARTIARSWPIDGYRLNALDIAVVEGFSRLDTCDRSRLWGVMGSEFIAWQPGDVYLGASYCSFWWD